MTLFLQTTLGGLAIGAVYGLIALGFVLIYKSSGVLNMAQGSLVLVGAFMCYSLAGQAGLPFPVAVILTLALSFLFGFLIERVFLRPLVGQPLLAVVMMTFALLIILDNAILAIYGGIHHVYPQYLPVEPLSFGGLVLGWVYLLAFVAAAIFIPVLALFYKRHKMGIAMRAVADDQQVGQSLGIRVEGIYKAAWGISCLTAAVGGIILGTITGVYHGLGAAGLKVFPALIIGGMDSILGAIIGGLIVGLLENLAGSYIDPVLSGIKEVFPYIILLIALMIKPFGLFGLKRIERI